MKLIKAATFIALLMSAPASYANIIITGVTVTPTTIGVNDSATITLNGYVKTAPPGQPNCTGVEIFFGDIVTHASTDPYKPAASFVRLQPASTGSFPITVTHPYTKAGTFDVHASGVKQYNGNWYQCGSAATVATVTVLKDTIQSVQSITPAVVNRQTSVIVKGLGSCSQNVHVNWGDRGFSIIAGPVDLKLGGIASHTYAAAGSYTVTASGSGCSGVATTPIAVALFDKPGRIIDRVAIQKLRERLDRFAPLPPRPMPGAGPNCPVCEGLAQQMAILDRTGHGLQTQSAAVLKDLGTDGKEKLPLKAPVTDDLVKQLDGYFELRTQLFKLYDHALAQSRATKAVPVKAK